MVPARLGPGAQLMLLRRQHTVSVLAQYTACHKQTFKARVDSYVSKYAHVQYG